MLRPLYLITNEILEIIRKNPKQAIRIAELYGRECWCTDIKWEQATHKLDTFAGPPIYIAGDVSGYITDFYAQAEKESPVPDIEVITGNGHQHFFVVHDFGDQQTIQLYLNILIQSYDAAAEWRTIRGQSMGYCERMNFAIRTVENFEQE